MLRSPSSGALPPLPAKPASASNLQNTLSPPANQQRPNSVPLESAAGGVSDPANPLYLSNGAGSVGKAAAGTGGLGGVGELLVTTPLLTAAETSPADSARESEADAASLQGARSGSRPGALTPTGGARSNSRSPLYARVSRSSSQPDITAPTGLRRASVASGAPDAEKKPAAAAAAAASASGASGAMVKQGSFLRKPAASSVAAALSGLTELNVSDQALQACPDLGPYLSSLITLDISRNQIQALHKSFERLSSLTALKASQNILKEIPSTIGRITSLEYLDFSSNIITQCPSSIGWLENLSTLLLQNNQLAKLPADLEKCRKLDNLEIAGNRLLSVPTFILRNTVGLGRDFIEEVIPLETMNGMKASHKSLSERAKKAMERASGLEQQVSSLLDAQRGAEGELAKLRTQLGDIQHKAESLEKAARAEAAERERLVADAAASVERFMRELQQTEASLKAERNEVQSLSAKLVAIEERIRESRVEGYRPDDDGALPPTGNVTLVFTDIQGSTAQWESNAKLMAAALKQHNRLMRARIKAWKGYEVKTEGDAFMIAFASALEAIRFCLDVQVQLTKEEWDPELLKNPESAVEEDEAGSLLWRGLRVRMGCHTGEPSCEPDPTTRRMDYFGPMVNRAARVEGICHGGQITVSGSAMKALEGHMAELKKEAVFKPLGERSPELGPGLAYFWSPELVQLKGLETPEAITQCLPRALGKRAFPPVGKATAAESATEQIKEMQSKNEAILEKLRAMESVVENVRGDADGLASRLRRFRGGGGASKDAASTAAITEAVAKFESLMGTISKLRQEVGDEVRESRGFRDHSRETEKKALRQLKAENERLAATNQQLTLRLANAEEHSRQNAAMKADLKRLQAESERLSRALEAKAGEAEALAAEVKRRDALLSDTEGKARPRRPPAPPPQDGPALRPRLAFYPDTPPPLPPSRIGSGGAGGSSVPRRAQSKEKSEYIQGAVFEIRELEAELARTKAKVFAAAGEKLEAERTAAALKEELEEVRGRLDPVERGREAAHGDLAAARARLAQLEEEDPPGLY
eukprot:tig00000803_g4325.t1